MLGRGIGISEEKLRHMDDDPWPDGVYSEAEAAIVQYAQRSTKMPSIDNATYQALAKHFSVQQIIEICLNVGLAQMTNRFNATSPGRDATAVWLPALGDHQQRRARHIGRP